LKAGVILKDFSAPVVVRDIQARPEVLEPIVRGLKRVITGPGVRSDIYHSTTGEKLFRSYPKRSLPIAGKTGTAQGAQNLPWNDSSAFAAFSLSKDSPYTAVAYLEKSGYGSRAAAPVVKCIFTALAGKIQLSPALAADPLDIGSFDVATPQSLPNPLCLVGSGSTVRD
jgi:penicillin-binding protein 2